MLSCTITSPKETKHYVNVQSVTLPVFFGQAQILAGHSESFFLIKQGNVVLRYSDKQIETLQTTTGECHVSSDTVVVVL